MPVLCDVNLLLALVTDRHEHHTIAADWIEKMSSAGEVVICRFVQTGLLRLLNNPVVMKDEALDAEDCWSPGTAC